MYLCIQILYLCMQILYLCIQILYLCKHSTVSLYLEHASLYIYNPVFNTYPISLNTVTDPVFLQFMRFFLFYQAYYHDLQVGLKYKLLNFSFCCCLYYSSCFCFISYRCRCYRFYINRFCK